MKLKAVMFCSFLFLSSVASANTVNCYSIDDSPVSILRLSIGELETQYFGEGYSRTFRRVNLNYLETKSSFIAEGEVTTEGINLVFYNNNQMAGHMNAKPAEGSGSLAGSVSLSNESDVMVNCILD